MTVREAPVTDIARGKSGERLSLSLISVLKHSYVMHLTFLFFTLGTRHVSSCTYMRNQEAMRRRLLQPEMPCRNAHSDDFDLHPIRSEALKTALTSASAPLKHLKQPLIRQLIRIFLLRNRRASDEPGEDQRINLGHVMPRTTPQGRPCERL